MSEKLETHIYGSDQKERSKTLKESLMVVNLPVAKEISIRRVTGGATVEERLFRFCVDHLESAERGGEMPEKYTRLSPEEFILAVNLPRRYLEVLEKRDNGIELSENDQYILTSNERIIGLRNKEENGDVLTDAEYELLRTIDAAKAVLSHEDRTVEVHNLKESINPLGKLGNVTLAFVSDKHHAPDNVETEIREQSFVRYGVVRTASKVIDKVAEGGVFSNIEKGDLLDMTGDENSPENLYKRYILREASLSELREWIGRLIEHTLYTDYRDEDGNPTQLIFVTMGDNVHDGARWDAQAVENTLLREMLEEYDARMPKRTKLKEADRNQDQDSKTRLIEINGNHDQDSRVAESIFMLTELYGHRVFTQEVAGDVMIVGLDTNIENPEWQNEFKKRAGILGEHLLEEKLELQRQVIERMRVHNGSVLIMGHNPSRIIERLAVKEQILQNSHVQRIIAGHTHKQEEVILPFTNVSGEIIEMDVVESFTKVKRGNVEPPKAFLIDLIDGKIGKLRVVHEPEDEFRRGVEARM